MEEVCVLDAGSFTLPVQVFVEMGETLPVSGPKKFICSFDGCCASFNKHWKLKVHLCKHTGEKLFVCEHEGCGKGFTRACHLRRHCLIHEGEKPFRCNARGCTEAFTTKSNLKKHAERIHENRRPYVCEFENCYKSFRKHQHLKSHQYEHTKIPPFKCGFEGCEKSFLVPSKLKRHEKVHGGYTCKKEDCTFIGKTWTEYQNHLKECHTEVICEQCNKKLKRKDFLREHQQTHLKDRPVFQCPREGCPRTYTTVFNLQSHILSFHEEKHHFTCEHPGCGKTFAMKQSLERHSVAHDPEKKKQKKKRPKRSLASRLSGFIPPKDMIITDAVADTEIVENMFVSESPNLQSLKLD
ncbi:transcription factor IIIA isoform X2 [Protopterus annectens]|uniref:transcription factor IIIA isoform X2 n=1 Tax=Protopterus annectens TaxID=7888 RepID=UPI001CFBC070|nr:transcription factor IIIA isoform X2 [Protopterus annectens]